MARKRRDKKVEREKSTFELARDELLLAIRQCGVLDATEDEQQEWMKDTVQFMAERHPELSPHDLEQLETFGMRFCQPVIPHGKEHTALSWEDANAA